MIQLDRNIFVYKIGAEDDGEPHYYVSPLSHEHGFKVGLRTEAIMGELTDGPENITHDHFKQNTVFIQFLAWVIGKHSNACPGLIAETERQQDGYVYILDQRTPTPDDGVSPEDIIGGVEIQHGKMLRFHASPKYQILTNDGFMQLERFLHERLIEELLALPRESH